MAKRKIFDELMEGVAAMKKHREGKLTLRSYKGEVTPLPGVDSEFIRETRKRMRCSRAVFARKLRINERTLEKWEQGRAKPNPQAAALVLLVRRYPDTLERLEGWRFVDAMEIRGTLGNRKMETRKLRRGSLLSGPPRNFRGQSSCLWLGGTLRGAT